MKKIIFACLFAAIAVVTGFARADEAEIRKSLAAALPGLHIDAIRKAGFLGLYEIQAGMNIVYTDEKGSYFIQGEIIDLKGRKNLTAARMAKITQIKFSDLPFESAIKTVRGNGKRVFATFEDPNCGYCKKLAKDLLAMNDVTIYTFLVPILSTDSAAKSKAIWCAADRVKAWNDWMVRGNEPTAANCDNPIEKNLALSQKLGVNATPTIFLANGERIPGAIPATQLDQELARVAAAR